MKRISIIIWHLSMLLCYGILSGCDAPSTDQAQKQTCFTHSYRIRNTPLQSISTDWGIQLNMHHERENQSLLCVFHYGTNAFHIVDVNKDEIIHTIPFPDKINKVGSISLADSNDFAFITDTTLYVYKNNTFTRFTPSMFRDEYLPLNYIPIIYNSKENTLIAGVLTYTLRKANEADYSQYFLNVYDLNTMTSKRIPFAYPAAFHGGQLGIPKVYLSTHEDDLFISFEFDDNVYKVNTKTDLIDTLLCSSQISNIQNAIFPKEGNKQEKMDAIQKMGLQIGGYGKAFYDSHTNTIYRLYRPPLPEKDKENNYYNSTDKGAHILALDLSNNSIREIQLANGQYYVPAHWSFNPFTHSLTYPKLEEHAAKKDICYYNVHSITVYNDELRN